MQQILNAYIYNLLNNDLGAGETAVNKKKSVFNCLSAEERQINQETNTQ